MSASRLHSEGRDSAFVDAGSPLDEARTAYGRGDCERAGWWLLRSIAPDAPAQVEHLLLAGDVAAAQDRYPHQAACLLAALDITVRHGCNPKTLDTAMQRLASLWRDLPLPELAHLEYLYECIRARAPAPMRLHLSRALAWGYAVQGEIATAQRHIAQAQLCASTPLEHLAVRVDDATLAVLREQRVPADSLRAFLEECIRGVAWDRASLDDLIELTLAAQALAEVGQTEQALQYCSLAARCASQREAPARARFDAFVAEARALAYRPRDRAEAAHWAKSAYGNFDRAGFAWRAARMALLLYQVERGYLWCDRAEGHLHAYPPSAFRRFLAFGKLTHREREVLALTRSGLRPGEIADRLHCADNTVRNLRQRILQRLGVKSERELLVGFS